MPPQLGSLWVWKGPLYQSWDQQGTEWFFQKVFLPHLPL